MTQCKPCHQNWWRERRALNLQFQTPISWFHRDWRHRAFCPLTQRKPCHQNRWQGGGALCLPFQIPRAWHPVSQPAKEYSTPVPVVLSPVSQQAKAWSTQAPLALAWGLAVNCQMVSAFLSIFRYQPHIFPPPRLNKIWRHQLELTLRWSFYTLSNLTLGQSSQAYSQSY